MVYPVGSGDGEGLGGNYPPFPSLRSGEGESQLTSNFQAVHLRLLRGLNQEGCQGGYP